MPDFLKLSKSDQLRSLKGLRENDTFQWLIDQLETGIKPKRDLIFDGIPSTLQDLVEREQNIGRVSQQDRVVKLLDASIQELEEEIESQNDN